MKRRLFTIFVLLISLIFTGCVALNKKDAKYSIEEAQWIRNGEPIIFEEEQWFPKDIIENLLNEEMVNIYTYGGENVYIEKIEVRPYNRLYTKFGVHKYRLFEK